MPFSKNPARQTPIIAEVTLALADLATAVNAVALPPNAVVQDIKAYVDTAFNAATTNTLSIGDGASATRYMNATSVTTTGAKTASGFGFKNAAADNIVLTYAQTGAVATTGSVRVYVAYTIEGRATEVQA